VIEIKTGFCQEKKIKIKLCLSDQMKVLSIHWDLPFLGSKSSTPTDEQSYYRIFPQLTRLDRE
jgi:hypothetical protein